MSPELREALDEARARIPGHGLDQKMGAVREIEFGRARRLVLNFLANVPAEMTVCDVMEDLETPGDL